MPCRLQRLPTQFSGLVLPAPALFVGFPLGVSAGWDFWAALAAGIGATLIAYGARELADRQFALTLFG